MSAFKKATKTQSKLRLTLDGPAGSGKTYSALQMASTLNKKVALIDTEHGSASKYADIFSFDVLELTDHSPLSYVDAIKAAAEAGYPVLIVDSLSHAWVASLELVDREKDKFGSGWRKVTPMHQKLVEAILSFPGHIICTMRSKMAYESEKDSNGRVTIRKVGMAPVMREGMEYEFDVVLDLGLEGNVTVSKTRCSLLSDKLFTRRDVPKIGATLVGWLNGGAPAAEKVPEFVSTAEKAKTLIEKHLGKAEGEPENDAAEPSAEDLAIIRVAECSTQDDLVKLYKSLPPPIAKNATVLAAFKSRKAEVR